MRLLLGISGGIAAYKTVELARRATQRGHSVRCVLTDAARQFVAPTSLQAVTGHPVRDSLWDEAAEAAMGHIELARWAEQILIAPATASLMARLAHGLADDLLTTLVLASAAPLALAPAMNQQMWRHPATQDNLRALRARGVRILGPGIGDQACGDVGPGRMLEPEEILLALRPQQTLTGQHWVVSAGPTFEDIDPVRFIGNRSSGKMGFAIAQAAAEAGARVTLVSGPVALETPAGVERTDVRSAAQMADAVLSACAACDVYVGAAAIADFRPASIAGQKIKKTSDSLELKLVRNPDILTSVALLQARPFVVGFAAETERLLEHARDKRLAKGADVILANDVSNGVFDHEDNALIAISADGERRFDRQPKLQLARAVVEWLAPQVRRPHV